jgi:hypothetical protein
MGAQHDPPIGYLNLTIPIEDIPEYLFLRALRKLGIFNGNGYCQGKWLYTQQFAYNDFSNMKIGQTGGRFSTFVSTHIKPKLFFFI